jgi:hypothetical protein
VQRRVRDADDRPGVGNVAKLVHGLTWILLTLVGSSCFAQEVTIRVIDSNGHALRKQRVVVLLNDPASLRLETDAKGEAHFTLPEGGSSHISVQVWLSERDWECACSVGAHAQDVIQKGRLVDLRTESKKTTDSLTPAPGEILFIAHRMPFLLRLFWPLYAA